jgi:uncharacterized protein YbjT (DUF2867 family)
MTVVVSGATGALGREVAALLSGQGARVRALGRSGQKLAAVRAAERRVIDLLSPGSLEGACDGARALVICSGASMRLGGWRDRASFHTVDYLGNLSLLSEARRARVRKVIVVSLAGALAVRQTEYAQAHERFVQALEESGIDTCVVRPTGFFSTFAALLGLAARGVGAVTGPGHARTNPIHEGDVARACLDALETNERQLVVGGPEVFTRARLAEMAFDALSRPARVVRVPGWVIQAAVAVPLGWANPRLAALVRFGVAVGATDIVAPAYGTRRLGDYLRERAANLRAEPARA